MTKLYVSHVKETLDESFNKSFQSWAAITQGQRLLAEKC